MLKQRLMSTLGSQETDFHFFVRSSPVKGDDAEGEAKKMKGESS